MYTYKLRPGYGSDKLLLEFVKGPEEESFLSDLFEVFSELNFKTSSTADLWMNDQIIFYISSSVGEFKLSKDVWDFIFIMAEHNQEGLLILDRYLLKSGKFEKMDTDFSEYKL